MQKISKKKKTIIATAAVLAAMIAVIAVIIAIGKSGDDNISTLADAGINEPDSLTLISHRGMNILAPENTLEAIQKSAELGYTHVEFDIRATKDGVWMLMHDEDIERTTNGSGKVSELTCKQILSFNVDKNCNGYENVYVPLLDEALSLCGQLGLHPVIEIKQSGTDFIESLLNYIGQRTGDCTVITFDREQAELVAKLIEERTTSLFDSYVEIYWLTSDLSNETLERATDNPDIGVSFNGNRAGSQEEINKFTEAGIKLAAWTVDKPERLSELFSLGIKTVTTNSITPNGISSDPKQEVTTNARP